MGDLLLTEKERARLKRVRELLTTNRNPYASDPNTETKTADQGGLDRDRETRRLEAVKFQQSRSEARHIELEQQWRAELSKPAPKGKRYLGVSLGELVKPRLARDGKTLALCCSFCGNEVERSTVTYGRGRLQKSVKVEVVNISGDVAIQERVAYFSKEVTACPDCVLRITPSLDKDGNLVKTNIRFPDTDG